MLVAYLERRELFVCEISGSGVDLVYHVWEITHYLNGLLDEVVMKRMNDVMTRTIGQ